MCLANRSHSSVGLERCTYKSCISTLCYAEVAGSNPAGTIIKEITQQYSVTSFFRNSAGSTPALHANVYALGSGFNTPLISETKKTKTLSSPMV